MIRQVPAAFGIVLLLMAGVPRGQCPIGQAAVAAQEVGARASDVAPTARQALPPGHFGFGTPASPERVARWDIDVKPDGEGLPAGAGTVSEGERLYRARCRSCHGPTGVEGPDDPLVSTGSWDRWPAERSVGLYWPYATTLFDYIYKAMPQRRPGTLTPDETYAVIAYLLHRNGLVAADATLSRETLPLVVMPARERFVPDDRIGGPIVR